MVPPKAMGAVSDELLSNWGDDDYRIGVITEDEMGTVVFGCRAVDGSEFFLRYRNGGVELVRDIAELRDRTYSISMVRPGAMSEAASYARRCGAVRVALMRQHGGGHGEFVLRRADGSEEAFVADADYGVTPGARRVRTVDDGGGSLGGR
jgi:hypothetical protein